jgi:hypothetical protein
MVCEVGWRRFLISRIIGMEMWVRVFQAEHGEKCEDQVSRKGNVEDVKEIRAYRVDNNQY